ncbi:MAG: FtsH protease activity modulator HflK [Alphaproteobacteria bacterium]|nr:FtsH protease activity modulator HflK [Alphaproteobacteria bacterium]
MPWTNQGGGSGGGGGGPWGRGPQGPTPPNLEDVLRKGQDKVRSMLPGGLGGKGIAAIIGVVLIIWLVLGTYRVEPGEQGVALIFGKVWTTTGPGLHWNFPGPIGSVDTPEVERINRVEVGLRTSGTGSRTGARRDVTEESLMLTGDENIIDIQFVVLWKISNAEEFLFNVRNPVETVKAVSESAMREVVGRSDFEFARTQGRGEIQDDAEKLIQDTLDDYNAGILVTSIELQKVDPPGQVIDAFRDVQAARADKERSVNEAQAYLNEVTQRAEGEAEQVTRSAEAYKEEKIAASTGDTARFLSVFEQYKRNPDVITRRVYLQTMENLLSGMDKILIDTKSGGAPVPYLPLDQLIKRDPRSDQQGGSQ